MIQMSHPDKLTRLDLIERGWTQKTIRDLAPKPEIKKSPLGVKFLYPKKKIEALEKTEYFKITNQANKISRNRYVYDKRVKDE